MSKSFKMLNVEALTKAPLHEKPYPYILVDNILQPDMCALIAETFPAIEKRGSFPLSALTYSGVFRTLIEELESPELKKLIGDRFDMDLDEKPSMITLRGHTGKKDGRIHVDSTSKLITFLLYLNQGWQSSKGCLRVLNNKHDINDFAAEVSPEIGRCLIFKVCPEGWHGHEPFVGVRRSIQLNYVTSQEARMRNLKRHRISAFLKKLLNKKDTKDKSASRPTY